jgi:hypothetical protein
MANCSGTSLEPARLSMCFLQSLMQIMLATMYRLLVGEMTYNGMSLLKDLMNSDQRLERLDLVIQNRLDPHATPERDRAMIIPGVDDAF